MTRVMLRCRVLVESWNLSLVLEVVLQSVGLTRLDSLVILCFGSVALIVRCCCLLSLLDLISFGHNFF